MRKAFIYIASLFFSAVAAQTLMNQSHADAPANEGAAVADSTSAKADSTLTKADSVAEGLLPETNFIDEVVWVVGDEPILRSDIEMMRMQAEQEGTKWDGDPDCRIPEQIAVQKLFLTQAAIDSIEVTESEIANAVNQQINGWIQMVGSQEKLEEYRKMSVAQMRNELHDELKNRELAQRMQKKLVEDVKVTPADVRAYFKDVPADSLPYIPTTVEVQIITMQPRVPQAELNAVKDRLRDFTERVNSGNASFAMLARLYSEDPGSARQGGELGFTGRGMLDPAFAAVAFNLSDPKRVSKIVESEYGYHIIQLIEKRGDKINCRHILLKPQVPQESVDTAIVRMDSLASDLRKGRFTFEAAASMISDDKDTKSNFGLMSNVTEEGRTSRIEMKDLPTEVARAVEGLEVGGISNAFTMVNAKGKQVVAIVKLKAKTDAHRATITEDYQAMQKVVLNKMREKTIHDWVEKKIKETYIRMDDRYKGCDFEYSGWVK